MQASRPLDRTHLEGGRRSHRFRPRSPKSSLATWPGDRILSQTKRRDFALRCVTEAACLEAMRNLDVHLISSRSELWHWRPAFSRDAISPHESHQTSVPEWDRQFRLVRVHHEHCEELGRVRLAG